MKLRTLLPLLLSLAASPLFAHWEVANPTFPWATPGQVRWLIDYATMEKPHIQLMLDAQFNLIQGGAFKPDALALLKSTPGAHSMQYICSRTVYHAQLFPKYPQLKDACVLNPDQSYKIIYNNPARYAGCWNQPAWLDYIKSAMDNVQAAGVDTIFFDNPMTWECYCPKCQELFSKFAKEKTGQDLKLNQFGKPTELENWFTIDTAERFWTQIHAYAQSKHMFIVANNMTYYLVNRGLVDGVFGEAGGHPPFQQDIAAYKIGLAASHGKPTGILDYIPYKVMMQRGRQEFNGSQGSGLKWVGAPIAEEFEVGYAQGLACGGNYIANTELELGRRIEMLKDPEDARIWASLRKYGEFAEGHPEVYAKAQPGATVGVLFSLTKGPREGEILGMNRGSVNALLWALNRQGIAAEVIVEDDLTPQRLTGLKAVIVDDVNPLQPEAAEGLRQFARAGGTVVFAAPGKVRDRFAASDTAKSLAGFFPGLRAMQSFGFAPTEAELDGYELEGNRIKTMGMGKATFSFSGPAGSYRIAVQYLDENDGKGSFDLLVDGQQVGQWQNDKDDDQVHEYLSRGVKLHEGSKITVVGHSDGGEYGRIYGLRVYSDTGKGAVSEGQFGRGRIFQAAVSLSKLPVAEGRHLWEALRAIEPVTAQGAWPEKLLLNLTRATPQGPPCAHLVNYDFRYDDKFALQKIEPAGPVTLRVGKAKSATLLSPDSAPQKLAVKDGLVQVPAVRVYSVVVLE